MAVCTIIRAGLVGYGLWAVMLYTVTAKANDGVPAETAGVAYKTPGNYCGVSCIYILMRRVGIEIAYDELIKREYIGSVAGSSIAELETAARDHGLYATSVSQLTKHDLIQCRYPVVLHVKSSVGSPRYDHYELFAGIQGDQALLLNPPGPLRLVSFRELVPGWDGNGLIVSAEPIDHRALFAPSRKRFMLYAVTAIAGVLALHCAKRLLPGELVNTRTRLFGLSMTQAGAFGVMALLCGTLYHFVNNEGLLANANATASIQEAHVGNFIPKVSEKKVHKLLDSGTVFIDARIARDYEAGHLEGSISVPVDANDVERRKATDHISKDARIVLYCQSAKCKFAETVAVKLMDDGFSNISIFRGGWAEWVAKNGKPKEAAL